MAYGRELAGALLLEADEFFDRALVLYLLRRGIRRIHSHSWAAVAIYYSNYFSATSFVRLNLHAVTHIPGGPLFDVSPIDYGSFFFRISQRKHRLGHEEVWRNYYELVSRMSWPDSESARILAPTVEALRFREQRFREKVNYRLGEGFREIYLSPTRLSRELRRLLAIGDTDKPIEGLDDEEYSDRLAAERLIHLGNLFRRVRIARPDPEFEEDRRRLRAQIVERYGDGQNDRRFGLSIIT
jgi:hypothetical protein